jgi:hypothetical protein
MKISSIQIANDHIRVNFKSKITIKYQSKSTSFPIIHHDVFIESNLNYSNISWMYVWMGVCMDEWMNEWRMKNELRISTWHQTLNPLMTEPWQEMKPNEKERRREQANQWNLIHQNDNNSLFGWWIRASNEQILINCDVKKSIISHSKRTSFHHILQWRINHQMKRKFIKWNSNENRNRIY